MTQRKIDFPSTLVVLALTRTHADKGSERTHATRKKDCILIFFKKGKFISFLN